MKNLEKRLDRVTVRGASNNSCYSWSARSYSNGVPRISFKGKAIPAHRARWMIHNGEIPKLHYIIHTCGNKFCTNIKHLVMTKKKPSRYSKNPINPRRNVGRLSINLPLVLIKKIKAAAEKQEMTITRYIGRLIMSALGLSK